MGTLTFFLRMLLFLFVAAVYAITPEEQFQNFISTYGKRYDSEEEFTKRFGIFRDNLLRIERDNEEHIKVYNGEAVFGVTKFSDLTQAEFKNIYLRARPTNVPDEGRVVSGFKGPVAESVDWVAKGATTPIKDQGFCGSCWAFSAVEAIESFGFLAGKFDNITKLSTQQVCSCDKKDGGCDGGDTITAYKYVIKNDGLTSFANYPYTSGSTGKSGKCNTAEEHHPVIQELSYKVMKKGEDTMKTAMNVGPVSICAAAAAWDHYKGGILKKCSGQIDHCAQVVGYVTGPDNYWVIKNSWGTKWGENGYMRLEMGKNLCKISNEVTYPTFD